MFNVSEAEESELRNIVQSKILESLRYPTMANRYENVAEAHPCTFDWAFRDSTDKQQGWSNLATWLKSGNGVYRVSSKPASGKSILMKNIFDSPRTRSTRGLQKVIEASPAMFCELLLLE
jgi:hypothetical protein